MYKVFQVTTSFQIGDASKTQVGDHTIRISLLSPRPPLLLLHHKMPSRMRNMVTVGFNTEKRAPMRTPIVSVFLGYQEQTRKSMHITVNNLPMDNGGETKDIRDRQE